MNRRQTLAIIGTGPSCIYLLKHLLNQVQVFRERFAGIDLFEKRRIAGMGMPYHPETTDRLNMSNISSEEIPALIIPFADWLRGLAPQRLAEFGIVPGNVSETEVYSRLALGEYLHAQYQAIIAELSLAGISVRERDNCKIVDVREGRGQVILTEEGGGAFAFDRVAIATGHYWPEEDHPDAGYFASPWPIAKLLPAAGHVYNFPIGTLGASLSAFDVVSSLAHRHGTFQEQGGTLTFLPHRGTEGFRIAMHTENGLLPHLQYAQVEPLRKIARHISGQDLLSLRDEQGFLRLETYFDRVFRPVLIKAFQEDGMETHAALLKDESFGIKAFVEEMTKEHEYRDAFEGMRAEMQEAKESVANHKPIHWKEALDDLTYTLNFYAEYLPAEDHHVLRSTLLPFVMNVIAALPLPSARILLALHDAGRLEIVPGKAKVNALSKESVCTTVAVENGGNKSEFAYGIFVDCSGQGSLDVKDFPFPGLSSTGAVCEAYAEFADPGAARALPENQQSKVVEENGRYLYPIGGVDIDRHYRLLGCDGKANPKVADIAFPHTSGLRPYSYGLQACNDTARFLVSGWIDEVRAEKRTD